MTRKHEIIKMASLVVRMSGEIQGRPKAPSSRGQWKRVALEKSWLKDQKIAQKELDVDMHVLRVDLISFRVE